MPLLPGVVVISPEFEHRISAVREESLSQADIARFWKVFAAFRRSIIDPTTTQASRMENFWWRVWGSEQKHLSGLRLGNLCSQISDDLSEIRQIRPRGVNKDSPLYKVKVSKLNGQETIHGLGCNLTTEKPNKILSSSRINMTGVTPHSILKKTKIPWSNGPRPTAHFISPHENVKEKLTAVRSKTLHPVLNESQDILSESRRVSGPNFPKKKGAFVVSKKRQSVMIRRQSSHSSTDTACRTTGPVRAIARTLSSSDRIYYMPSRRDSGRLNTQLLGNSSTLFKTDVKNSMLSTLPKSSSRNSTKNASLNFETIGNHDVTVSPKLRPKINFSAKTSPVSYVRTKDASLSVVNNSTDQENQLSRLRTNFLIENRTTACERGLIQGNSSNLKSEQNLTASDIKDRGEFRQPLSQLNGVTDVTITQETLDHATSITNTIRDFKIKPTLLNITATSCVTRLDISAQNISSTTETQISGDIFAKRPVKSTSTSTKLKSTNQFCRSKSQLSMLLEKDRARVENGSTNQ